MEKSTVDFYKELQRLVGTGASWLDTAIALTLTKTKALLAVSIARDVPRSAEGNWRQARPQI
jgi:hypothetical protein